MKVALVYGGEKVKNVIDEAFGAYLRGKRIRGREMG